MEILPHVLVKPLIPVIPTDDREFRELKEDLRAMGCEGLLAYPWNVQSEDMLREFLILRGNQWDETTRRDPKNWTPNTWAKIYGFKKGVRRDGQAGEMVWLPKSLKGRSIRKRASIRRTV